MLLCQILKFLKTSFDVHAIKLDSRWRGTEWLLRRWLEEEIDAGLGGAQLVEQARRDYVGPCSLGDFGGAAYLCVEAGEA